MRTRIAPAALVRIWLLVLLALLGAQVARAAAVAIVTDLQGKAAVTESGRSVEATILTELASGAQVQLAGGATLVTLYLGSGTEYVFKGPAQIVFQEAQPNVVQGAAATRRNPPTGKEIRIRTDRLGQGALVMRAAAQDLRIRLLSASATRVLEMPPVLRWQELQPGLTYQVALSDDTGRLLHEAQTASTSLRWPASVPLKDGASYTWTVSAHLPDGRKYSSTGDFRLADAALRAQALALRADASAPVASRVAYAAWLELMELLDDARSYWRALAAERPQDARLRALAGR